MSEKINNSCNDEPKDLLYMREFPAISSSCSHPAIYGAHTPWCGNKRVERYGEFIAEVPDDKRVLHFDTLPY